MAQEKVKYKAYPIKLGQRKHGRRGKRFTEEAITSTEKQRSCKTGEVYSAKLKKCVTRKGQDPRFSKDRPKKSQKALADEYRKRTRGEDMRDRKRKRIGDRGRWVEKTSK